MKKHLHEVIGWPGPITNRQYEVWCHWLKEEQNQPSRADYYSMQTALEVRQIYNSLTGNKSPLELVKFKIEYRERKSTEPMTLEDMKMIEAMAMARVHAAGGMAVTIAQST